MLRKHIAVDLGTANTLVFVQSQGIVINEPSVVAVDTINERVIAVGKEAKDYIGKTPQRISTIRPLRDGVIADFDAAQALIATFLKKVIGSWPIKPDVVICADKHHGCGAPCRGRSGYKGRSPQREAH